MNARSVASLALKQMGVFVLVNRLEYLVHAVLAVVQQRLGTMPGGTCNSPWRILVLVGPFLAAAVSWGTAHATMEKTAEAVDVRDFASGCRLGNSRAIVSQEE